MEAENTAITTVPITRIDETGVRSIDDPVAIESPLTIVLNNQELVTMLCSPKDLEYLVVGFLFSEGLLESKDELKKITIDAQRGIARVETKEEKVRSEDVFKRFITSGCGRGASFYSSADLSQIGSKVESKTTIAAGDIFKMMMEFQHHSEIFRSTGGVHSSAMSDGEKILVFNEDIGRHNAVDKIFGECLSRGIPTEGKIVLTSGRISSEILLKVARRQIPILISKSAPTNLGVKLADNLGITLAGFARSKRVNIYTHHWRITTG